MYYNFLNVGVAELANALGSGPNGVKALGVQVPPPTPVKKSGFMTTFLIL